MPETLTRWQKRYREFRAKGLCGRCGAPSGKRARCPAHEAEHAATEHAAQQKRRAAGLCVHCRTPSGDHSRCERHRREANARERRNYASRKAAA